MPTNLPPEYFDAEERFRAAESNEEKIAALEELLATVPKHKGTDKLRADLRRRLSKLRTAAQAQKGKGKHESAFHVEKEGVARVVVTGPPNAGKSALVAAVTHATPKVSEYPFTTWTPVPGMMVVRDVQIQLVDTPALSREHIEPDLFNLIRSADLLLVVVDLQSGVIQQIEDSMAMLSEHHIYLCGGANEPPADPRAMSCPGFVLVNKVDDATLDEDFAALMELLEGKLPLLAVSAQAQRNLEEMKQRVFEGLDIIRIFSKMPGKDADLTAPFVIDRGGTIDDFAAKVHQDFAKGLKTARIWGTGVHDGQMVGRDHVLHDGDIVELRV